jgi:hypothetical protein
MYTRTTSLPILYIRNIIPADMGIPLPEHVALSGWGYADFHAGVNFALTEFYEVRLCGVLGKPVKGSPHRGSSVRGSKPPYVSIRLNLNS